MNSEQVAIVQRTFALAAPMAEEIAATFYTRLFELDPNLRPMFKGDIKQQGDKLMTVLAFVVSGLNRPETILGPVQRLGERHGAYGVRPEHYATVGAALLGTLSDIFGPAFTTEVEDAWAAAYGLLAGVMQESMQSAPLS